MYRCRGKRCLDILVSEEFTWQVIHAVLNCETLTFPLGSNFIAVNRERLDELSHWRNVFHMRLMLAGNDREMRSVIKTSRWRKIAYVGVVRQIFLFPYMDYQKMRRMGVQLNPDADNELMLIMMNLQLPSWEQTVLLEDVRNLNIISEAARSLYQHYHSDFGSKLVKEREKLKTFEDLQQFYSKHFHLFCWTKRALGDTHSILNMHRNTSWQQREQLKRDVIQGVASENLLKDLLVKTLDTEAHGFSYQLTRFINFLLHKARMYFYDQIDENQQDLLLE